MHITKGNPGGLMRSQIFPLDFELHPRDYSASVVSGRAPALDLIVSCVAVVFYILSINPKH